MNTFNSFANFGDVNTDALTKVTVTPIIPKPVAPAVPTPQDGTHKWYDIVTGLVNTTSNLATSASDVISATKTPSSGAGYNPNIPGSPPPVVKSNTGMYVLIGVGIAAVVGVGILVLKKKKKGLGNLDTAKTAKGRKAQRGAVFAKLDNQGDTFPKNSQGIRTKRKKGKKRK